MDYPKKTIINAANETMTITGTSHTQEKNG